MADALVFAAVTAIVWRFDDRASRRGVQTADSVRSTFVGSLLDDCDKTAKNEKIGRNLEFFSNFLRIMRIYLNKEQD